MHYGANKAAADALAAELGRERVHLVQGDLTDPTETRRVWEESVRATGPIDVLVNNAGAWIASPIDDDTGWTDGWAHNLALNFIAPADLTRYAIAHFRDHAVVRSSTWPVVRLTAATTPSTWPTAPPRAGCWR